MGLPEESAEQKTGELSGGQQKRVGIARALALSPRYIVFDESLSGLDVILRKKDFEITETCSGERTVQLSVHYPRNRRGPLSCGRNSRDAKRETGGKLPVGGESGCVSTSLYQAAFESFPSSVPQGYPPIRA